jgi:2-polyprenyl-6-hydroxyphenyl methylase/3-demethylubiquinone-9 3-methyltransferase
MLKVSAALIGCSSVLVYYFLSVKLDSINRTEPLPESLLRIDNKLYDNIEWWSDRGPFRLLRLMNSARVPYFVEKLSGKSEVLDIGCGGGFVSESLSLAGFRVTGLDASMSSLVQARAHAEGVTEVRYIQGSAYALPFPDGSFDGVVISDVLEHLNDLNIVASEIFRVLRPGGVMVFDTINRTIFSYIGIFWLAQEIFPILPEQAHDWRLFIRPEELRMVFARFSTDISEWRGIEPVVGLSGFTSFRTSDDLSGSYAGYLVKM